LAIEIASSVWLYDDLSKGMDHVAIALPPSSNVLALSAKGSRLATFSFTDKPTVRFWAIDGVELTKLFETQLAWAEGFPRVQWSPTNEDLAVIDRESSGLSTGPSGTDSSTVDLVDLRTKSRRSFEIDGKPVKVTRGSASLSGDGQRMVAMREDGHVFVWSVNDPSKSVSDFDVRSSGKPPSNDAPPADSGLGPILFRLSSDGRRLAITPGDGGVTVYDTDDRGVLFELSGTKNAIRSLDIHGSSIVTASSDGAVRVWDLVAPRAVRAKGEPLHTDGPIQRVAFSDDGSFVFVTTSDYSTARWSSDGLGHPLWLHRDKSNLGPSGPAVFNAAGDIVVTHSPPRVWNLSMSTMHDKLSQLNIDCMSPKIAIDDFTAEERKMVANRYDECLATHHRTKKIFSP
jgi:WD40 repeat protein